MELFLVLFYLPLILIGFFFSRFLFLKQKVEGNILFHLAEFMGMIVFPITYLTIFDFEKLNNCCGDSAVFSSEHRLSIYVLIVICLVGYYISMIQTKIMSPIIEIIINVMLLIGLGLNLLLLIHIDDILASSIGNISVILLLIIQLIKRQRMMIAEIKAQKYHTNTPITELANKILMSKSILKYPLLAVITIPFIFLFSGIMLLFGQKVDSLLLAFTQTYKHGFSELDHMCKNVVCGEHYLCSVAAMGHGRLVRPIRYGRRRGAWILCNRQLLVSNAFEEMIAENFPSLHKYIRRKYNIVGSSIHKYYYWFENPFVSDIVYLLMKPIEWSFVFFLYLFYRRPEDHINKQYWPWE